jgi:pyruvate decarboxylase
MSNTIPFAQYIFSRLRQLGCHSVHGVPGDFTLRALDYLPHSRINWIGNANELCAGYAADGYARAAALACRTSTKSVPQIGALCTTYGVGELSVINAIAGSYSESIPVVHLVGTPSRKQWRSNACVHHTLGDGRLKIWAEMATQITCAQADLSCDDVEEAVKRFDDALLQCVKQSKPIYVNLPSDMGFQEVPSSPLDRKLSHEFINGTREKTDEETLLKRITSCIKVAKRPLIIADGLSYPFDFAPELNEIVKTSEIPTMCFSAGKGVVDEALPSWIGPLTASTEYSRTTDLALIFGPLLSDTNTAAWSAVPDPNVSILFGLDFINVFGHVHRVQTKEFMRKLRERLREETPLDKTQYLRRTTAISTISVPTSLSAIEQDAFWHRMSSFLRPYDTVLLANGTPLIGGRDMQLSSLTQVIASGIWCSIGHMLPAAQGVAAAKRDHSIPGRTILFEGDGSFQVTCQALSDIIRYKLDVTIFMCNNAGYTYERLLHGLHAEYNDVPAWRYVEAAKFFGATEGDKEYPILSARVENWSELEEVLAHESFAGEKGLKMIDVIMGPEDVPKAARAGLKRASEALRAS